MLTWRESANVCALSALVTAGESVCAASEYVNLQIYQSFHFETRGFLSFRRVSKAFFDRPESSASKVSTKAQICASLSCKRIGIAATHIT